jgi:hypothetical protein
MPKKAPSLVIKGKRLINSGDMAALVGLSEWYIRHLANTGKIPARKIGGRWYFEEDEVLNALNGETDKASAVESTNPQNSDSEDTPANEFLSAIGL